MFESAHDSARQKSLTYTLTIMCAGSVLILSSYKRRTASDILLDQFPIQTLTKSGV